LGVAEGRRHEKPRKRSEEVREKSGRHPGKGRERSQIDTRAPAAPREKEKYLSKEDQTRRKVEMTYVFTKRKRGCGRLKLKGPSTSIGEEAGKNPPPPKKARIAGASATYLRKRGREQKALRGKKRD